MNCRNPFFVQNRGRAARETPIWRNHTNSDGTRESPNSLCHSRCDAGCGSRDCASESSVFRCCSGQCTQYQTANRRRRTRRRSAHSHFHVCTPVSLERSVRNDLSLLHSPSSCHSFSSIGAKFEPVFLTSLFFPRAEAVGLCT